MGFHGIFIKVTRIEWDFMGFLSKLLGLNGISWDFIGYRQPTGVVYLQI